MGTSRTDVMVTFVQETFTHMKNISAVINPILMKLKVGSWEHFEQIPTVTVTFVLATFVHVHIRNISTVTDTILIKL